MSVTPSRGRRGGSPSQSLSPIRDERILRVWTFNGIRILGSGEGGDLLVLDSSGNVVATNTPAGEYTFTSPTFTGTDFSVLVDSVSLLSADETRILIGTTTLKGRAVFVGHDAPAVAVGSLGKVDLTAQVADIATTDLSNTPPAGVYEAEIYLACTTADAAAGTLTVTVGWTDNVGATTSTPVTLFPLTATGRTTGRQIVRMASGNITYAVAVTGIYGSAVFAIYVRVRSEG